MKRFKYRAKKGPQEVVQGTLAASSQDEAVDRINAMGLVPVDLEEEGLDAPPEPSEESRPQPKAGGRALAVFYRQLGRLVRSGVPMLRALGFMAESEEDKVLRVVAADVQKRVRQGESCSRALAHFPRVFSDFDLALIQAGESVGKLDEALLSLADYHKRQEQLRSRVRRALAYPLFVGLVGAGTVAFLMAFVMPRFARFFAELGEELPLPTQILIASAFWAERLWVWFLAAFALAGFWMRGVLRSPERRRLFDHLLLRTPGIGGLIVKVEAARFSRTLELLLRSGMQILSAVSITVPVVTNVVLRSQLEHCSRVLVEGGSFGEAMARTGWFPPFICHVVRSGEESGRMDEALGEAADWCEEEVSEALEVATNLLEPLMILLVGLVLGAVIVAILLPVFSMNAMME